MDKAGVQLVQTIYNTTYFVDLQDSEGELIGYSIQQLLQHLKDTYIDVDNLEDEINEHHRNRPNTCPSGRLYMFDTRQKIQK